MNDAMMFGCLRGPPGCARAPDPAARIHELRTEGNLIDTHWTDQGSMDGSVTGVAIYVLRSKDEMQLQLIPTE